MNRRPVVAFLCILFMISTATSSTPTPGGGLVPLMIMAYVCGSRRKNEIGGWLLYFYIQLYLGVIISVAATAFAFRNYLPESWAAAPGLYPLFLVSTVPPILIMAGQLVVAEVLRKTRDYAYVRMLRVVLWLDVVAAVIATVIDARYFTDNLFFDVILFVWPMIWLPYFYRSVRVAQVFETKDWLHRGGLATA